MKSSINDISGVYGAVLTPMHADYSIHYQALIDHCHDLIKRGCQGVVLFGTTGEGSSFSVDERIEALKHLVNQGVDPKKIILGISCTAIKDVLKLVATSLELGCAAVLVVPPFFYKRVEDSGIVKFYAEIIKAIASPNLKILLYHIPQYSGVPITLNIIKSLTSSFPNNVIGLKESEGSLFFVKEILSAFPNFKLFLGNELHISKGVQLGATGSICGVVNAFPELICSLYEHGKDSAKPNHNEKASLIIQTIRNYPIFPAIKSILEYQKGAAWHILRPPLDNLEPEQRRGLIQNLEKILLLKN